MAVQPIDWNAGGNTSLSEMVLADKVRGERQGRSRIAGLIEPALQGDRTAMAGVFQGSPEMGTRIAQAVGALELGKQRDLKAYTEFVTHGGMGVLSMPPDQQGAAYVQLLTEAQGRGYPLQGVPTEWGPQAKQFLQMQVNRAMPFARFFKTQGGGGGAPAGGGGGWGGPPAPRVSDAGPVPGGPMVADTGPPMPAVPQPRPTVANAPQAPQPVPQPQIAAAGPMPMAMPPSPQITTPAAPVPQAPAQPPAQAPQQPFQAPSGPMMAQNLPTPAAAPQAPVAAPAPPPTQVAAAPPQGGGVPDDSGEGRFVGGAEAERAFKLQPGEQIKIAPKDGKPITDSGGVWVQTANGSVEWRLLDPQGRPIRVQQVNLGDRVRIIGANGETIEEIPIGRSPNAQPRVQTLDLKNRTVVLGPDGEEVRSYDHGRPLKPVDNSGRDDLTKVGTPALEMSALFRDFKPEYAGKGLGVIGDVENTILRNFGDGTGQAQFWQRYNAAANVIRNQLFGSALTATEKAAFESAMINPGMNPDEIKKNLGRQRAIMLRAASRMAGGMLKGGANQDEVEHYLGLRMRDLPGAFDDVPTSPAPQAVPGGPPSPPPAPPGARPATGAVAPPAAGPRRYRFNPATGELE